MKNKLVVIRKSLKIPKLKKMLLYEMKFLVPIYSCLQNPWLGGYRPQIPVPSVICLQLNLLNPPPEQNYWVRHWSYHSAESWRLNSAAIWRHVARRILPDVSNDDSAFIFRLKDSMESPATALWQRQITVSHLFPIYSYLGLGFILYQCSVTGFVHKCMF